jgi:enamine deaminase RidA (YjgF/YER057c/UK114 family)
MPTPRGTRQMNIRHTPGTVAAPFGPYSHAIEVPEGSRLLYISGEVGVLPDGTVPEGELWKINARYDAGCRRRGSVS